MSEYIYKLHYGLPPEREGEWEMLMDNIDLIMTNSSEILSHDEFFYTEMSFAHISSVLSGTAVLTLGSLLLLWGNNQFLDRCSDCSGPIYITGAAGNPLTGSHQFQGFCPYCRLNRYGNKKTFHELYKPALELALKFANYTQVKKIVNHYFSPGGEKPDGIREERIKEKIASVTLAEVISKLKE